MTDQNQPWQRQPYETDTAFDRFHTYYLIAQSPPRSVDEAYRLWKAEKGQLGDKKGAKLRASTQWQTWAWPKGDNVMSWPERAQAFDNYRAKINEQELIARHMPKAEVVALLSDIARGDMGDFSQVVLLRDLDSHKNSGLVQSADSEIVETKTGSTKIKTKLKLYSKLDALDKLARHYGLYDDKLEVTWKDTLPKDTDPSEVIKQFSALLAAAKQNANSND